jgi:hypothetical protein
MNKKQVLEQILNRLWQDYKNRVEYANIYANLVEAKKGEVINDHIALRSIKTTIPNQDSGIIPFLEIFEAFDYEVKNDYQFPSKKLSAVHLEHEDNRLPKIFVSELLVSEFAHDFDEIIKRNIASCVCKLNDNVKHQLQNLKNNNFIDDDKVGEFVNHIVDFFTRPWNPPQRSDVFEVNKFSQYAAWVLLHGNSVNHFTAYINFQKVNDWPDIETTLAALSAEGVPLKDELEGEKGSILRQSASEAVTEDCQVRDAEGHLITIPWSYAYYEFAERGFVTNENGENVLFQGFLGEQATNLFEMTDAKK